MTKNYSEIELWTGIRNKIPLCCILFYECVWYPSIKKAIVDYVETMPQLTDNQGIVMCPECVVKTVTHRKNKQKIEIRQIIS